MGVSRLQRTSDTNDFSVAVGASGNEEVTLDREYPAGSYSITSKLNDTSLDIYAVSSSGALVGHTATASLSCSAGFTKLVIVGSTVNDVLTLEYKATYFPSAKGTVTVVSPYISEVSPASAPDIDDTMTITGGNFADNVQVSFVDAAETALPAKNVVRVSSTELLVTRPDNLSAANSPYTLSAVNPDVPVAQGTRHRLTNSLTAGTTPVWQTAASLVPFWSGTAYSIDVTAADDENSDITYSIISGELPAGLTLNTDTGNISGTSSGNESSGDVSLVTIRATDTGGNYLDRQFTFTANTAPTWVSSGTVAVNPVDISSGLAISASPALSGAGVTYSIISGTLSGGLGLQSTGQLTGASLTPGNHTVTIRATDEYGAYSDQELTFAVTTDVYVYNNGDQNTALTGGWSKAYDLGATLTFNSDHMFMGVPSINGRNIGAATNNAIDITNFSTLEVYWTTTDVPYGANFGLLSTRSGWSPVAQTERDRSGGAGQLGFQRQTLDISSYTGNYFIYVATYGAENLSWNGYIAGGNTSTYEVILK